MLQDCLKQLILYPLALVAKLVALSLASSLLCNKLKSARNFLVTAKWQDLLSSWNVILLGQTLRFIISESNWKLVLFLLCCLSVMGRSQIDDPISQRLEDLPLNRIKR